MKGNIAEREIDYLRLQKSKVKPTTTLKRTQLCYLEIST